MKILIVEDDKDTAQLIAEWVKPLSCDVDFAYDLCGASQIIATKPPPEVVILDLRLPDSTAEKTMSEIARIRTEIPDSLLVILSGAPSADQRKCLDMGAHGFVHKLDVANGGFLKKLCNIAESIVTRPSEYQRNIAILETVGRIVCSSMKKQ